MFWSAINQTPLNKRTNQNAAIEVEDENIEENVLSQVADEDDDDQFLGQVGSESELNFGNQGFQFNSMANMMGGGTSAFDNVDNFAQGLADNILAKQKVSQEWYIPGAPHPDQQ